MAEAVCDKCGGAGWIFVERDGVEHAARCDCRVELRVQRSSSQSGIPPLYKDKGFDNFALPADNPIARNALSIVLTTVRSYAQEFPALDRPGLLILGDPGSGKTHLAVAALRRLLARGFGGTFFDYQHLLDQIKAGYDPSSGSSSREAYRSALDTEILLLDDLGAHRVTDWVEDTVTSIITYRCNHKKALIATTNLPDADAGSTMVDRSGTGLSGKPEYRTSLAEKIGMRARSRLFEMCRIIRMPAIEDYRIRKAR